MSAPTRQPVLFIGHGSPMNAIEQNRWSDALRALGTRLSRPAAVLVVSAHWLVPGSWVTAQAAPGTIHDFGGFPPELFAVRYPAPGAPALAESIAQASAGRIRTTTEWGLDHGCWSVLRHLFPQADVPVLQLSLDERATLAQHAELGASLAALRDQGVLILGSGNIVHNLGHAFRAWRAGDTATPDWAGRFDRAVATALQSADRVAATIAAAQQPDAAQSHPTPEHFLPLLYAVGASDARDRVEFPIEGFDMGSLSMRSVCFRSGAD
ncbi:MAG TPA: 4,5-DOPA dioxygenase extradiol [Tahibacter sp.]|uniref:4,5-DOPA-extradiol-dioxygenase n=1 Tax=Tahibacter sp. TaxID=2056211 RepID=UPI002CB74ADE|nr:4,5-DOPA dioxygenase extradiol [Tahibacter sp.]HSX59790.1 4,5-DOPA dioxygenase extradiol [Tahibacter sp.]